MANEASLPSLSGRLMEDKPPNDNACNCQNLQTSKKKPQNTEQKTGQTKNRNTQTLVLVKCLIKKLIEIVFLLN